MKSVAASIILAFAFSSLAAPPLAGEALLVRWGLAGPDVQSSGTEVLDRIIFGPTGLYSGTMTNTTDPTQSVTAPIDIFIGADGACIVRIGPPLHGSGTCRISSFDRQNWRLVLISTSPSLVATISWRIEDRTGVRIEYAGEYEVTGIAQPSLPERGTLELVRRLYPDLSPIPLKDGLTLERVKDGDAEYLLFRERDIVAFHRLDGSYAGFRGVVGKAPAAPAPTPASLGLPAEVGEPPPAPPPEADELSLVIVDYKDGSKYIDPKSNAVLFEWVTDGTSGYYSQTKGQVTSYFDRFFRPLPWSSQVMADSTRVFIRTEGDSLELYDDQLKPVGIRLAKTPSGRTCWLVKQGEITSFYDEHFKPLNWHFVEIGKPFYVTFDKKGWVHCYDTRMREIRDLAAYEGTRSYRYVPPISPSYIPRIYIPPVSPVYAPTLLPVPLVPALPLLPPVPPVSAATYSTIGPGLTSSTTYQNRIGNTTFSNTLSSTGTTTSATTQHLGGMDLVNANSSNGSWLTGSIQNIGSTHFGNFQTPSGSWMGSSQSVGGFVFHNFTGPQGQSLTGSSIRIGDFVFTQLQ